MFGPSRSELGKYQYVRMWVGCAKLNALSKTSMNEKNMVMYGSVTKVEVG